LPQKKKNEIEIGDPLNSLVLWIDNFIKYHCYKNTTKTHIQLISQNRSTVATFEKLKIKVKIDQSFLTNYETLFSQNLFGKFLFLVT